MNSVRLSLVVSTSLLVTPSAGFSYCSEAPREPWCITDDDTFRDENAFEDCRWELERFLGEIEDNVECRNNEQDDHRTEIESLRNTIEALEDEKAEQIEDANDAIRKFNCGAESGEACW